MICIVKLYLLPVLLLDTLFADGSHGFAKELAASQRKSSAGNALISVSLKIAEHAVISNLMSVGGKILLNHQHPDIYLPQYDCS